MMRMTVLASGSRGNSTVVASSRTRILVDAGLSCRELFKRMQQAGEDPCALDAILITHEHQDHVQGLSVAARKLGIPVYFTEATHRAWLRWMNPRKRMSYADWLRGRQQEAAARAGSAQGGQVAGAAQSGSLAEPAWRGSAAAPAAPAGYAASSSGSDGSPGLSGSDGSLPPVLLEENPFYREQELAECVAEEEAELAACGSATERLRARTDASGVHNQVSAAQHAGEASAPATAGRAAADPCALPGVEYFRAGACFSIGDIEVLPFTIPHDAADPVGFVFKAEGIRVGMATDLGYMPASVTQHLRGCDIVMVESNHDLEMLRDGPYPWSVKQRVLSRVGHLSNAAAADFLEKGYDGQAAYVVLAHLSESNNMPELARVAAEFALRHRMSLLANKLVLAGQHSPTESLCL